MKTYYDKQFQDKNKKKLMLYEVQYYNDLCDKFLENKDIEYEVLI